jgi:DNA-binding transcriptional LysR family regulator
MISASPRRLSVFKSVVDAGGFNVAATRLGIAQPSVGAHIKALEAQIGQPLFYRHRGSRPKLTKAGEALYAYTVEMLAKAAAATHTLADLRSSEAQTVTIAAHRDVATRFLSTRLAAFTRRHPKARIVTRIGTIEEVLEMVRTSAVNVGLFLSAGAVAGLRSQRLAREPLTVVAAPNHRLAHKRAVTADEIAALDFVTGLKGSRYFALVDRALKAAGIGRTRVVMEVQESTAVKEMVRHGAAVACLPRCTVEDEIAAGVLVPLDLAVPLSPLDLRCACREPVEDLTARLVASLREGK